MNPEITAAINKSPVWRKLNENAKAKTSEHGVKLPDDAYQKLRDIFVLKTILEDPEVFKLVSDDVWDMLQEQEKAS